MFHVGYKEEGTMHTETQIHTRAGSNIEIYLRIFVNKMFEHSKLRC